MRWCFILCLVFQQLSLFSQPNLLSSEQLALEPTYYQLDKALLQPASVRKLHLDDLHISAEEAWAAIPQFNNLQSLTLEGTFFKELPNALLSFKNQLQEFCISDNEEADWKAIFETLKNFTQLRKLSITYCKIGQLPQNLGNLTQLKILNLSNSALLVLPATIGKLNHLETLDLRSTQLSTLPKQLAKLNKIKELYLGSTPDGEPNKFEKLPEAVCKLSNLTELQLAQNPLGSLPKNLSKLKLLQKIDLASCTRLNGKATFEQLCLLEQLTEIIFSDIKLNNIPPAIKNLQQLERLTLRFCQLSFTSVELLKLPHLKYLNLVKGNSIAAEELQKLKAKIAIVE